MQDAAGNGKPGTLTSVLKEPAVSPLLTPGQKSSR